MKNYRLAITGASGFVGRQIVPILLANKFELVLIGRNQEKLKKVFGNSVEVANYENLEETLRSCQGLLHLAVMNNSQNKSLTEFREVNVLLLEAILASATSANIDHLIYVTTLHAKENVKSHYAITKREAEALLYRNKNQFTVATMALPAVYSDSEFAGRLSVLNRLPLIAKTALLSVLGSMRPTVHVADVAKAVSESLCQNRDEYRLVSDRQMKNMFYAIISRIIDLAFAFAVIALFWWLLLVIWFFVKATSNGPGIFAQERVGRYGKKFVCYKFRTMYSGTKEQGTHEISMASVTSVGAILRKLKLDELPQVWNILGNQMSLVGPRPCLPNQIELIEARREKGVLDVKCGITGLAQVLDIDMSIPERLANKDAEYVAMRTIPLDIKIILRTFLGAGLSDRIKSQSITD